MKNSEKLFEKRCNPGQVHKSGRCASVFGDSPGPGTETWNSMGSIATSTVVVDGGASAALTFICGYRVYQCLQLHELGLAHQLRWRGKIRIVSAAPAEAGGCGRKNLWLKPCIQNRHCEMMQTREKSRGSESPPG